MEFIGEEMLEAILHHNTSHFQQARWNGASAAQQSTFANSLRSYRTSKEEVLQNMNKIISGEFDQSQIQEREKPFYHALQRVSTPDEKIRAPISPANAKKYSNSMRENTVTSVTSGHHMGIYKGLCSTLKDKDATEKQEQILSGILTLVNICGQSGIMLPRFCKARDVMLQKKANNYNITALRTIKIFEADMNQLLKHISRNAMQSIEKIDGCLSDMQHR